jgi:APA family basic amino acid/polyamine antiporter
VQTPKVFTRDATGFVKELGFADHFLISQGIVLIINGFVATVLFAPYFFPGANLYIDFALGGVPAICMAYVYGKLSAGIARSGGDYVWSTRILGPIYGLVQMIFIVVSLVYFNVFNIWQMFTVAVGPTLFGIGAATRSTSTIHAGVTLSSPGWGYPLSLIVLIAIVVIGLLGIRAYAWFARIAVPFYLITTAIFAVTLILLSTPSVQSSFDSAMRFAGSNATYSGVISGATSSGFSPTSFNLTSSLEAAIPWGFLTYVGFNWSSYSAGETKGAKTYTIARAFAISVGMTLVILEILTYLVYSRFGAPFVNSLSYMASTHGSLFPVLPFPNFILTLANPAAGAIIGIALFIGWMINSTGLVVFSSRMLFAASFDRVLPKSFSNVNERFRTPHWAVILMGVLSAIYLTIYWFGGAIATILNTSIVLPIGLALPLFAAFLLPIVKPGLYKRAYQTMKGAAALSAAGLVGAAAFAIYAISETTPLVSGTFLGANLVLAYEVVVILVVIAVIIYFAGRYRMKNAGVDPKMIFSEIPPE